jgi:hypothetical protein
LFETLSSMNLYEIYYFLLNELLVLYEFVLN